MSFLKATAIVAATAFCAPGADAAIYTITGSFDATGTTGAFFGLDPNPFQDVLGDFDFDFEVVIDDSQPGVSSTFSSSTVREQTFHGIFGGPVSAVMFDGSTYEGSGASVSVRDDLDQTASGGDVTDDVVIDIRLGRTPSGLSTPVTTHFGSSPRVYTSVANGGFRLSSSVLASSGLLSSTDLAAGLGLIEQGRLFGSFQTRFEEQSGGFLDLGIFGNIENVSLSVSQVSAVPLPAGAPLLVLSLGALGLLRRRKEP